MSNLLYRPLIADKIIEGNWEIVVQSSKVVPALAQALKNLLMLLLV
jgi:hypothetical protein